MKQIHFPISLAIETVTFSAGLFSSLLAAAVARNPNDKIVATKQARFLQSLFRHIVFDVNLVLQMARHMENLAVRMVFESKVLDKQTKQLFYRNLLYSDEQGKRSKYGENGARKTHQWFLKAVFGTSQKNPHTIDPGAQMSLPADTGDPFSKFSPDGHLLKHLEPKAAFAALPGDPHIEHLLDLFKQNTIVGNIILAARQELFRGYDGRWAEFPLTTSTSYLITDVIEEVARTIDVETASSLSGNFLRYQGLFIDHQLKQFREQHPELDLKNKLLLELLCHVINFIPYDDRPDLVQLWEQIGKSQILGKFVEEQRRKLGNMMNMDIIKCDDLNKLDDSRGVDMGFALGFGNKQCVQADFLVPAILAMANELGVPLVVIPEGKPTNRPLLFGSDQTLRLLRNLPYLAHRYSLDKDVAEMLQTQFNVAVAGVEPKSVAFDLTSVSFIAKVSRFESNPLSFIVTRLNLIIAYGF